MKKESKEKTMSQMPLYTGADTDGNQSIDDLTKDKTIFGKENPDYV